MLFQHRFVSVIALIALLLGNAAGWIHVGSHHHDFAEICCQHVSNTESLGDLDSSAELIRNLADTSRLPFESGCSCHHQCVERSRSVRLVDSNESAGSREAFTQFHDNPCVPCNHDSDDCGICKLFFASRASTEFQVECLFCDTQHVLSDLISESCPRVASVELESISLRGPPLA